MMEKITKPNDRFPAQNTPKETLIPLFPRLPKILLPATLFQWVF